MESYCLNIRALKRMNKSAHEVNETLRWMQFAIYCSMLTVEQFGENIKKIQQKLKEKKQAGTERRGE